MEKCAKCVPSGVTCLAEENALFSLIHERRTWTFKVGLAFDICHRLPQTYWDRRNEATDEQNASISGNRQIERFEIEVQTGPSPHHNDHHIIDAYVRQEQLFSQ